MQYQTNGEQPPNTSSRKMVGILMSAALLIFAFSALASSKLEEAVAEAELKIKSRSNQIENNIANLNRLKLVKKAIKVSAPVGYGDRTGRKIKCHPKRLHWRGKKPGYLYNDCEYTLNIADQDDIAAMVATLSQRKKDGWNIVKSEVAKQDIVSPGHILTVQSVRFEKTDEVGTEY